MKLAVVVSQRPCRVKECSQLIRWHETANGFGYWINAHGDHQGKRHLCPRWEDKRSRKSPGVKHQSTEDIILAKIARLEVSVEEIRMKITDLDTTAVK
jgi:hypothetical protein